MPTITALKTVVTHQKILIGLQSPADGAFVFRTTLKGVGALRQVGFIQSLTMNVHKASIKRYRFPGEANDTLYRLLILVVGDDYHIAALRLAIQSLGLNDIIGS